MQGAGGMGGGIISSALQLIKEKERQADKASERISDGIKTQMELTANQGSWTGSSSSAPQKVIKEKVVEKEKAKEPEESTTNEDTPEAPGADEDEQEKDVANMGIFDMARGASK